MIEQIWEECGVVRHFSGAVTWADFEKALDDLSKSPHIGNLRFAVNDFRECTSLELAPDELELLAAKTSAAAMNRGQILRVAHVVTATEVLEVILKYLAQDSVRSPTKIFTTYFEAREWATRILLTSDRQSRPY